MMKCICSGEHIIPADEVLIPSSESLATRDYSSAAGGDARFDSSNIEEAESSLRETGFLNYEEARALLGRLEYQKGNVEAALRVFEGIDIAAIIPGIKFTVLRRTDLPKHADNAAAMSMHAVTLLIEANFLKAKSLQALGRYSEAAQSCRVILDTFESAMPDGLPDSISRYGKLVETIGRAVELLPELYRLASSPLDSITAYRRALLYHWNLDPSARTRIEKSFAVFLLYGAHEATPPNLRSQLEDSFVPRNNVEEAVLLLLLVLEKISLRGAEWDPSILDHLGFALSIAGECRSLAMRIEELNPSAVEEKYCSLALCYLAEGDDVVALNLLRNLLSSRDDDDDHDDDFEFELLLASKICSGEYDLVEEGIGYVQKLLLSSTGEKKCLGRSSTVHYILGLCRSTQSRGASSETQRRILRQSEALEAFEAAERASGGKHAGALFSLSLENAERRNLDSALVYAKRVLKLEGGCSARSWILFARILSAQRRYLDAEGIVDAALEEAGKWDHGELLRTKARLQIAQNRLNEASETYTKLLALLQVRRKSCSRPHEKKHSTREKISTSRLEMETWHDLARVYSSLSQWNDAEICLKKSEAIDPHSASRLHSQGLVFEARGDDKEALKSFKKALDIDPNHVPSLISAAVVLRRIDGESSLPVLKSFLTDALRLDRTNHRAWYCLGLLYKSENGDGASSAAAECFEAAAFLEESEPVEPFR
ncbi:hypothetical protein M569_13738 [Genlisea aurea]|uniref:Uncharacterized protein n=1 Tax=Genlisea aurea TaxID=192259 RepID=S8C9M1_9LAMI|nr:hypothetical protein M569_13738 [Genlisea aurea]